MYRRAEHTANTYFSQRIYIKIHAILTTRSEHYNLRFESGKRMVGRLAAALRGQDSNRECLRQMSASYISINLVADVTHGRSQGIPLQRIWFCHGGLLGSIT